LLLTVIRNQNTHPAIDDFGVKYFGRENAQHLIDVLKKLYEITTNWKGGKFLGLTIQWDYKARTCDISMPGALPYHLPRGPNMPLMPGQNPSMDKLNSSPNPSTTLLPLTLLSDIDSKKSLGPCSTMAGPLIQRFWLR
jgi:hypothetical protein